MPDQDPLPTLFGVDCVDVAAVAGLQFDFAMGYAGGWWPTYSPLCAAYPQLAAKGRVLSYAVSAGMQAELCDCERGDLTVAQVDPWIGRQADRGVWRPGVYASLNTWANGGLRDALAHRGQGIRRIVADWTYVAGVLGGYDCQQWTDRYRGRNVDGNQAVASFLAPAPQPQHVNTPDYDVFEGSYPTQRWGSLDERLVAEEYDGARQHPDQYATYLLKLEAQCKWLADRVAWVAIYAQPNVNGTPSWAPERRGRRYQELIHRAHGARFV
jgi:hypothetical protein